MSYAPEISRAITPEYIAARIERLPPSKWDFKVRSIIATATFFDGYDIVAIAFVLPSLIGLWHLRPQQIGLLLSAGFAGQLIGAPLFGSLAERYGRIKILTVAILMLSVFGVGCALSAGYWMLVIMRFFQGLGLGGEIPVAATFVAEIASAKRRGRFVLLYQASLPTGMMVASVASIWIVPAMGWQWVFGIGALPAILLLFLSRLIPESPRWLARRGRLEEADKIATRMEEIVAAETGQPLAVPEVLASTGQQKQTASFANLFERTYLVRTISVWTFWFGAGLVGYGLLVWLPSIFRTVYHMSIRDSLIYSSLGNILCLITAICSALVIDRYGRKPIFFVGFFCGGLPMLVVWILGAGATAVAVMILAAISMASISIVQLGLWAYTPEIYPTRMRSLGTGFASAFMRLASIVSPNVVGVLIAGVGVRGMYLGFGLVSIVAAILVALLAIETKKRRLEEIAQ